MIAPPVFLAEGWDLKLYESVRDAELDLEPIDVESGIFVGYDAEGRLLKIETRASAVVLSAAEASPTHQKELEELLRGSLRLTGHPPPEADSLESLVEAARVFTFRP